MHRHTYKNVILVVVIRSLKHTYTRVCTIRTHAFRTQKLQKYAVTSYGKKVHRSTHTHTQSHTDSFTWWMSSHFSRFSMSNMWLTIWKNFYTQDKDVFSLLMQQNHPILHGHNHILLCPVSTLKLLQWLPLQQHCSLFCVTFSTVIFCTYRHIIKHKKISVKWLIDIGAFCSRTGSEKRKLLLKNPLWGHRNCEAVVHCYAHPVL